MHKSLAFLIGLILTSCLIYILLGSYVVLHYSGRSSSTFHLGRDLLRNATKWTHALVEHDQNPKPSGPDVHGALRHYISLVDNKRTNLSCTSCALVSSSGFLIGKNASKEIDSRSCVIRLNMAPVRGFEKDVGSRTSLRVLNFFMIDVKPEALPNNSRLMVWGLLKRKDHLQDVTKMVKHLSPGSTIHGQTHKGELEAEELYAKETGLHPVKTRSWLSTGWFAMMLAVDLCQEVHVYGMVPADYCARRPRKDVPYHYYDLPHIKECSTYRHAERDKKGNHRFLREKVVFARWAQRYNITFHHPSWPMKFDARLFHNAGLLETILQWIRS
ncbi:alpha-N-acetyl-neuraminyl-2,3-beta-galactosyl-1,3-N-acetyl-galactosaminide alpha-2,6-sialyltransferase-like [Acanthaster planci]|uniref:Alpha-N-acetyl-neuraminyl-2,3-beta-galactosyl-1, 3-N-acetyl-galactosaminide alpha-2,6-sialyltransferase-like n=1 Tax=Acanthaster planci TaxID=133434 RepID=A0A8B7XTU8_ACAPL|nr:alpha-N-acetyl-neuraminyl-2,3-beta-galactosyl-1,3-N-acetyl-galactosaminide alpha-2,6-sialyltransferase-like [Acanthaster planci]